VGESKSGVVVSVLFCFNVSGQRQRRGLKSHPGQVEVGVESVTLSAELCDDGGRTDGRRAGGGWVVVALLAAGAAVLPTADMDAASCMQQRQAGW
jgi:hypothetical protein